MQTAILVRGWPFCNRLTTHTAMPMKLILLLSFGLLHLTLVAAEPLQVVSLAKEDETVTLSWNGGEPPYEIFRSADLQQWAPAGTSTEPTYTMMTGEATPSQFFRVMAADAFGDYVGQWRIAEGEFGEALAKHRLKSLWDFYRPQKPTGTAGAKAYFTQAKVRVRYIDGSTVRMFTGSLAELPEAEWTFGDRQMDLTWNWGEGEWERAMTLTLSFPYDIDGLRFQPVHLSDPTITLKADYAVPKPNLEWDGKVTMRANEEAALVEVDDKGERPDWWDRELEVTHGGVTVASTFSIGVPLIGGSPAFIFKTPLLVTWGQTTISGLTDQPIILSGRFSQTYYPFHHNFIETLWLEPASEPGMDPRILDQLRDQNIQFIIPENPSAFPDQESTLKVMGFDHQVRSL